MVSDESVGGAYKRTHSTISRMTLARFALSSLYFRSSPLPEPVLSVVATLLVCVMLPLREMFPRPSVLRRLTDSGREEYIEERFSNNSIAVGMSFTMMMVCPNALKDIILLAQR